MAPEKFQWKHLYDEVVTSGLCTGCAGCVIACPHDVLDYDDSSGRYKPFQTEDFGGASDCSHGDKGCTSCTRACPRFRDWETDIDQFLFGREREPEEVSGMYKDIVLARASDKIIHEVGTIRMGDDPKKSALNKYCQAHDCKNLFVVDAGPFVQQGDKNATWTILALSMRTAEYILAEKKRQNL